MLSFTALGRALLHVVSATSAFLGGALLTAG